MAKLSYRDAQGVLCECPLGERASLGRHPNQTIQLLDRVVSKEHAVVHRMQDGGFLLKDGGSRNGTYVNGEVVKGAIRLNDGDKITIGSTDLFFHSDPKTQPLGVGRVTIHADGMDTHIRSRLASMDEEHFQPEIKILDVASLRRDYEKLRISHELGQSIGLEMDLQVLLEKILEKAFEIFPADRGVILLRRGHGGELAMQLGMSVGQADELLPLLVRSRHGDADVDNVRISQTIINEILEGRQAVLSSDAMMDSRFNKSHSIVLEQIRSTMSVPLLHDEYVLGIIHLDSKIARGAFTEKDLQILTGFARQAAMMIEHNRLLEKMREEIRAREHLDRLLSPQLVEEVLSGRLELKKGGELRRGTVMFADIRGFTTLSEELAPQQVVAMLNEYFEYMVDILFQYNGTLDKFIGDEMMAVWGAPLSTDEDTLHAVRAAWEMQQMLLDYNEERAERGERIIQIGIGLNTGELVAGYMGSTRSMNYTVMGDTVNTAARFCSAAGPGETLIGENTFAEVGHLFETELLPPTKLKGKHEHVDIYRVLGLK
jgi:adenylate cyclase